MLPTEKKDRKERPIASGVLDYFPLALAEVARVSFIGNQQHNPGEPMHWDRSKSSDHADCIVRHLIERGTLDTDGLTHSGKCAWRALALLQEELEKNTGVPEIVDLTPIPYDIGEKPFSEYHRNDDYNFLVKLGCPVKVAGQITGAIQYHRELGKPYVYVSGPMRGYDKFNYPAFDTGRDYLLKNGYNVISPADIDRLVDAGKVQDQLTYVFRDFWALYFIAKRSSPKGSIALLPGWSNSVGARAEHRMADWMGLTIAVL